MASVVDACTPAAILEIGFNATAQHSLMSLKKNCLLYFLLYASHCDFASLRCKNCKNIQIEKTAPRAVLFVETV